MIWRCRKSSHRMQWHNQIWMSLEQNHWNCLKTIGFPGCPRSEVQFNNPRDERDICHVSGHNKKLKKCSCDIRGRCRKISSHFDSCSSSRAANMKNHIPYVNLIRPKDWSFPILSQPISLWLSGTKLRYPLTILECKLTSFLNDINHWFRRVASSFLLVVDFSPLCSFQLHPAFHESCLCSVRRIMGSFRLNYRL
jgi:hypothetical protein